VCIRALRKERGVPEKDSIPILAVFDAGSAIGSTEPETNIYLENQDIIARLAQVSGIEGRTLEYLTATPELGWTQAGGPFVTLVYERTIDVPAERERLTKDIGRLEKGSASAERQLGNEGFLAKAPANVVEGLKKQFEETKLLLEKAKAALDALPEA